MGKGDRKLLIALLTAAAFFGGNRAFAGHIPLTSLEHLPVGIEAHNHLYDHSLFASWDEPLSTTSVASVTAAPDDSGPYTDAPFQLKLPDLLFTSLRGGRTGCRAPSSSTCSSLVVVIAGILPYLQTLLPDASDLLPPQPSDGHPLSVASFLFRPPRY